jgi:MFS family permease
MPVGSRHWSSRLPFYYGWLIIGVAFVTMAISVSARTAFSLLLAPLLEEFGWDRGLVAGAFSFGFLCSAVLSPIAGRVMDRHGPRVVIGGGVCMMTAGLLAAPAITQPWQLYATLGVLVGAGASLMSFTAQSLSHLIHRGGRKPVPIPRLPFASNGGTRLPASAHASPSG